MLLLNQYWILGLLLFIFDWIGKILLWNKRNYVMFVSGSCGNIMIYFYDLEEYHW
jgi:hypothetical protein